MSVDVAAYLPTLDDPAWVQWQADQITDIARRTRTGTAGLRYRERLLCAAVHHAFNTRLDQWHEWEWFDGIGGVVTVDRTAPSGHPYLGAVPLEDLTPEAVADAKRELLHQALTAAQILIGRI